MSFIKKAGKGVGNLANTAIKTAFSTIISEIAGDILKESGIQDIAKDKIVDVGFKVVKDLNLDVSSIKKDLLKNAIMKELKL